MTYRLIVKSYKNALTFNVWNQLENLTDEDFKRLFGGDITIRDGLTKDYCLIELMDREFYGTKLIQEFKEITGFEMESFYINHEKRLEFAIRIQERL